MIQWKKIEKIVTNFDEQKFCEEIKNVLENEDDLLYKKYCDNDLNLLCGKSVYEAITYIDNNFIPLAISANCIDYQCFKKLCVK